MTVQEKILQKLGSDLYPGLNSEMIFKLTNESDRGAVLIGTTKIEEYLKDFILKILPVTSKRYTKRLLEYPGPLSSFSSKMELLYAFRYIDHEFNTSLNVLRKLRNDAAHSDQNSNLTEKTELIEQINEFQDNMSYVISELSMNNLLKLKKSKIENIYQDEGIPIDIVKIKTILSDFRTSDIGLKQHRIWQLSYGIVFMCLYVLVLIEENDYLKNRELIHPIIGVTKGL